MPSDFDNRDSFLKKVARIINSTLIFFTAFVLSSALLQALIGGFSKAWGYTVNISYNIVHIHPSDYHYWNKARIAFVFVLPPVVSLLIGLLLMSNLIRNRSDINLLRAFRVWLMFCMINLFLGHLFISPIGLYTNRIMGFYQTFAVLASWMYLNVPIMSFFAVGSIAASVFFGAFIRNEVLKLNYSSRGIKTASGKTSTIFQLFILPVMLAFFPIATICTRDNFFPTVFMLINLIIISFGMLTKSFFDDSIVRCGKHDVLNHLPLFELLIAGAVWGWVFFYFK